MGVGDKFENRAEDLGGRAKEAVGDVTGDDELKADGATDQLKAKAKDVGESVKDLGASVKDKFSK
ncbi:CsbD family protein [Brevibacterium linens]|uniref:CsbD-like n=1 Tax=Brevibacterium linens ATCC 9172 TaxID=1255617 RepID=A0A2H1JW53_BRELN|nr:CsbD family protein [Brevibacterium linens]AZU00279.1 CsbD family protein [Brevibacterium linens]KAB1947003.1 CsbD family protein [Brevibacterium linens ATCC 9172]SMX91518.1 CsbD-like [Brevibacterium linens ATCC 9172]